MTEHERYPEILGEAVDALLAAGYSPAEVADWWATPNPWIGRRTPAEAARAGDHDAVRNAVEAAVGPGGDARYPFQLDGRGSFA